MTKERAAAKEQIPSRKPLGWQMVGLIALRIIVLVGVIVMFLVTNGAGLHVEPVVPIETLTFDQAVLHPGTIEFTIRNTSPQPITISAININDAFWPFTATPGATIPRLSQATVKLAYHWVQGESYDVDFFTANSIRVSTNIPAAADTATPTGHTPVSDLLSGFCVGVSPL